MAQPSMPGNGPWLWASDRSHAATPTATHTGSVGTSARGAAAVDAGTSHRVRGRWVCFLPSFAVSDRVWPLIVRACREGSLGPRAKASTVDEPLQPPCVVVYVKDAADALDAERVRNSLRALGLSYPMVFMPDPDDVSAVGAPSFPVSTAPIRVDTAQHVPAAAASATAMAGGKRRIPEAGFGPVPEAEPRRVHGGSLGWAAAQPARWGSTLQHGGEDPSECSMGLDDDHVISTGSSRKFGRHELSPPRFPVLPSSTTAAAASPFADARYAQAARRQLLAAAARRRLSTEHPFGSSSWSQ